MNDVLELLRTLIDIVMLPFVRYPLIVVAVIYGAMIFFVRLFERSRLVEVHHETDTGDPQPYEEAMTFDWAAENSFDFNGVFEVAGTGGHLVVWTRPDPPTFLVRNVVHTRGESGTSFDFVTVFEGPHGLTTATVKDTHFFPSAPGDYKQSFSDLSHDERWQRHAEAVNLLVGVHRMQLARALPPLIECFEQAVRGQMKYVRTLRLWPLRGVYWFFWKRSRWHGLSVAKQFELGWVKPPPLIGA
ncbi:MAG: hypothetical protein ACYSUI_22910 [Planctomycetota bacterium]|jgi:hypothetical protein